MSQKGPGYGTFKNGIPYVRFGKGKKGLIVFFGGPGNTVPTGFGFRMLTKGLQPFLEDYTIHLVTRKSGLSEGCTTKDLSDDYAEMIREEFEGHVDVVIGISYGGMIAQHFAADYADLCDHMVIAMAAHKMSEAGKKVDYRFAELLSQGKDRKAMATIAEALFPKGMMKPLAAALLWMVGGWPWGPRSDTFEKDVLIEAKAEVAHNATESIGRIEVPVLVICGGEDFYFPLSYVREMAEMIEKATLKVYEGKGHNIMSDKRFAQDIIDYIKK